MTEPGPNPKDLGDFVKDVIDDVLNPKVGTPAPPSPSDSISGMLKDVFKDSDGDGTPDAYEPKVPASELTHVRKDAQVADFLHNALAQIGDKYQRGVENSLSNADPTSWDGSELVEWAANRAGVMVNDGAANQYQQMTRQGGAISVEDALHTPGAILYEFTGDPIHGTPTRASTAISLGDGRIIDIDPKEGVRIVDAASFTFTHAGVMPGFTDAKEPGAAATTVVQEALVEHGIAAPAPEVEDTPEIAALAARAADLRAKYVETIHGEARAGRVEHKADVEREQKLAEAGLKMSSDEAKLRQEAADAKVERVSAIDAQADAADARGDHARAEELREDASATLSSAQSDQSAADHARAEAARYQQQVDTAKAELAKIETATNDRAVVAFNGDAAVDQLEQKVTLMRSAHAQQVLATDLEQREADARAAGNTTEADRLAKQLDVARTNAANLQRSADAVKLDEPVLQQIDALATTPAPSTPPATTPASDTTDGTPAAATTPAADPAPTGDAAATPDRGTDDGTSATQPAASTDAGTGVGTGDGASAAQPATATDTSAIGDPALTGAGTGASTSAGTGDGATATQPAAATDTSSIGDPALTGPAAGAGTGDVTAPAADTGAAPDATDTTTGTADSVGDLGDPGFTPPVGDTDPSAGDPGFTPSVGDGDPGAVDPGFTPDVPADVSSDPSGTEGL